LYKFSRENRIKTSFFDIIMIIMTIIKKEGFDQYDVLTNKYKTI